MQPMLVSCENFVCQLMELSPVHRLSEEKFFRLNQQKPTNFSKPTNQKSWKVNKSKRRRRNSEIKTTFFPKESGRELDLIVICFTLIKTL